MTSSAPEGEPSRLRRKPTPYWLLVAALALAGGVWLLVRMAPHEAELKAASGAGVDGPAGVVELTLTSSAAVHQRVVGRWQNGPEGIQPAYAILELDIGLIAAYVLCLWSLGFWLSGRIRGSARQRFRWRLTLWILLAAAADAVEDVLLWRALETADAGGSGLAPWIAVLGVAKVAFLAVSVCAVARAVWLDTRRDLPTVDVWVRYLVHLRVSWIGALVVGLGPLWMESSPLFRNTFVLDSQLHSSAPLWIGGATALAAWICVVTASMTFRLAPVRFGLPAVGMLGAPTADGRPTVSAARRRWVEIIGALLIASGTGYALWKCNDRSVSILGWFVAGIVVTIGVLAVVEWLVHKTGRAGDAHEPRRSERLGFFVEGYWQAERWRLLPGHRSAIAGVLVLAAVFALMERQQVGSSWVQDTPALAMLWFMAALVVAVLAGVSFAFDRFGVPVLLVIGLWSLGAGYLTRSTHYFYVQRKPAAAAVAGVTATKAFEQRRAKSGARNKVVLVCAAGGGIQAAAWTARVLTGLSAKLPWFDDQIGLISTVSGGSVGAMFYIDGRASGATDAEINDRAQSSSLNPLAWALVHKDLRRPLGVFLDYSTDRGIALERTWRQRLGFPTDQNGLRSLSMLAGNDRVLPFAFNASLGGVGSRQNKGRRLVFSNLDLGEGVQQFRDEYREFDIDLATAVRMSSAFPYATPMARAGLWVEHARGKGEPEPVLPGHSVADGGYFDNFGVVTGLDWLAQLENTDDLHIAILRIVAFPDDDMRPGVDQAPDLGSWANALLGPVDLLLSTWSKTQEVRAGTELKWLKRAVQNGRVVDLMIRFSPKPGVGGTAAAPPLSWHLTTAEREAIEGEWADGSEVPIGKLTEWWRAK